MAKSNLSERLASRDLKLWNSVPFFRGDRAHHVGLTPNEYFEIDRFGADRQNLESCKPADDLRRAIVLAAHRLEAGPLRGAAMGIAARLAPPEVSVRLRARWHSPRPLQRHTSRGSSRLIVLRCRPSARAISARLHPCLRSRPSAYLSSELVWVHGSRAACLLA